MFKTNFKGKRTLSSFIIVLSTLVFLFSFSISASSVKPMNVLIILTDDQRHDTLWAMPKTTELLGKNGVTFTEAIVSTPLCCPSRSGLLSGGYFARNTGVLTNLYPNGGAVIFSQTDKKSLPARLQRHGYNTGLFGKYLNEYPLVAKDSTTEPWPYIPPGWSSFVVSTEHNSPLDWFNYPVTKGSSESNKPNKGESISVVNKYVTEYFGDEMLSFIETSNTQGKPFFAILSTHGPHGPSKYPEEDANKFIDYTYSAPSMSENLNNKPVYVQEESLEFGSDEDNQKAIRKMLRSLQPIDRSVEKIVDRLTELGELENTVIFFTSDHGTLWGEHKLKAKSMPYEEAIRAPLIAVYPEGKKNIVDDSYVYANLDVAATVQEIAGIYPMTEGKSLLPLLKETAQNENTEWRSEIYGEWFKVGQLGKRSSWNLIKLKAENGKEFKYIEYQSGEKELYVLSEDPYEQNNVASDPKYAPRIERLSEKLANKKGLSIEVNTPDGILPVAKVGVPYEFQFKAWGSREPYTWSATKKEGVSTLPAGLMIDSSTGKLYGTPTEAIIEPISIGIKVVGSSKAIYADRPQEFITSFQLMILPQEKNLQTKQEK